MSSRREQNLVRQRKQRGRMFQANRQLAVMDREVQIISHPPSIVGLELRHSVTLRYLTNAAVSQGITFQNLLDTLLVATTATAGTNLFQTVRVRRVRVWSLPALGSVASVSVEFNGTVAGISGDQALHTDTSMGVQPAHVDARPSARCLAADYQISSNAPAFALVCPSGSVVDVELSFRSQYADTNAAAQNALVAATAGSQYIRGLDGLATATSKFVPEYATGKI